MFPRYLRLPLGCACLSFAACGGGHEHHDTGTGALSLAVADAPIDTASHVVVSFAGVEFKPANGAAFSVDFAEPRTVDLLNTANGQSVVLVDSADMPTGAYQWLRLKVRSDASSTESYLTLRDGSVHPLYVPSGSESGLKLQNPFSVSSSGVRIVVVDFDLRNAIVAPKSGDAYWLKPTLRVINADDVGVISGSIDPMLLSGTDCSANPSTGAGAAVYVYNGANVTPDDVGGSGSNPLASTLLALDERSGGFAYTVAWLPAASYTVALNCDAEQDDPQADDDLDFPTTLSNITVTAGQTSTADFVAP